MNDTLTIDISFGNIWQRFATFESDGDIVSLIDTTFGKWNWYRLGLDTLECENQELGFSNITNTPMKFQLNQNYPNPFYPITTFNYSLFENSFVDITVYDLLGNKVNNFVNEIQASGNQIVQWNATNSQGEIVSAGVYLYKVQVGNHSQTKKMIFLK
jgi:hypothetical protein